jgi:hypothetical protein
MTYEVTEHCGVIAGFLQNGNFFEGLERKGTKPRVEFRKGRQTIREFPDQIFVRLEVLPTRCPPPANPSLLGGLPGEAPAADPTNFMNGWKFAAAWMDAGQAKPVADVSAITTSAQKVVFAEQDRAPWTYTLTLPSKGIPLEDSLVISVVSDTGAAVTTISVSL